MAKYDVKFKQEVVQKYLAGGSARGLAKEYRLDNSVVRRDLLAELTLCI